jgi:biotin synthase
MRFETTDKELFERIKPNSSYEKRFEILSWLKCMGYQVGSGIMIGLPGQTNDIIARDILKFKELDLDMVGNGPFISNPQTPLVGAKCGDLMSALKLVALTRIVTKNAHIPATTALGTIHPEGRQKAFLCGANVIMPNVTPKEYRKHYLLYPNKICIDERPSDCARCIKVMVEGLGRTISNGHGHSFKMKR